MHIILTLFSVIFCLYLFQIFVLLMDVMSSFYFTGHNKILILYPKKNIGVKLTLATMKSHSAFQLGHSIFSCILAFLSANSF